MPDIVLIKGPKEWIRQEEHFFQGVSSLVEEAGKFTEKDDTGFSLLQ